jgi:hypothetical protein
LAELPGEDLSERLAEMGARRDGGNYTGTTLKSKTFGLSVLPRHEAKIGQEDDTLYVYETERQDAAGRRSKLGTHNVWVRNELTSEKLSEYESAHKQTHSVRHDHQNKNFNDMLGDQGAYSVTHNNCKHTSREAAYNNKNTGENGNRFDLW